VRARARFLSVFHQLSRLILRLVLAIGESVDKKMGQATFLREANDDRPHLAARGGELVHLVSSVYLGCLVRCSREWEKKREQVTFLPASIDDLVRNVFSSTQWIGPGRTSKMCMFIRLERI
jgi:hypothetical protein